MRSLALAASLVLLAACNDGASDKLVETKTVPINPWLGQTVLGNPSASVEIVEYASTTCSHCRAFHQEEFPKLKTAYIDTGKAKLRYVVLPTAPAHVSVAGAAIARCAGQEKFFDVIGDLFEHQPELIEAAANPVQLQQKLFAVGQRHGLSQDEVGTCIEHKPLLEALDKELEGLPAEVTGTPAFFVNGKSIEENSAAAISFAVDAALSAGPAAAPAPSPTP
jgi:protein-disulfide isomerase